MRTRTAILAIAALGLAAPLGAQITADPNAPRFGFIGGVNSATAGGSDAEGAERLTTFMLGGYLVRPMGGALQFRPELLYSNKGFTTSFDEEIFGEQFSGKISATLSYVEVPLLFQYSPRQTGSMGAHLYGGPSFGYQVGCRVNVEMFGTSFSSSCDDADEDGDEFRRKKFEAAGIIGAGYGFELGQLLAAVGARYQHGFTNLSPDGNAQNRVISVYLSLEFGRR